MILAPVLSTTPYPMLVPILTALEFGHATRNTCQATVYIVTDNADLSGLGVLVAGGERATDADEATAGMRAINRNGVSITT